MGEEKKKKCRLHNLDFPFYQYLHTSVWCQDCSTEKHPIMMQECDGVYYYCPICKKEVMVMTDIKTNVGTHWGSACSRCKELEEKYNIVSGRVKVHNK